MEFTREVLGALGAPFPDDEVEFLPRGNFEGKARALAYIDARSVMRRLDAVVGASNWSFDFELLSPDGKMVKGKLTVLGVTKCDAGEGASEDEVLKSAVSDALKRCAVHFGIGRYLYYLPSVWAPYDQRKRQFSETPRISPAAVEKALSICGIPTQTASSGRPAARTGKPPESSVDAAATARRRTTQAAETGPSYPAATGAAEVREQLPEKAKAKVQPASQVSPPADPNALVCTRGECGKPLTKGQHDVSVRAFGQPLCPSCQKSTARSAA